MTAEWSEFYIAIGGAGAALAGLVMVSISVNTDQILAVPSLSSRAAAAISSLILVVVVAGVGLMPGQPARPLGIEILIGAIVATVTHVVAIMHMAEESENPGPVLVIRSAVAGVQLVPVVVGAVMLMISNPGGLSWVGTGMILIIIGSVLSAWVLLIEIRR